jgi:DNA 3'-phosphatase
MKPCAIFTLNNTLIKTRSKRTYPLHSEDWVLIDKAIFILKELYFRDYKIIILSNQFNIEDGITKEKDFIRQINSICSKIEKELKLTKNSISYFYCTKRNTYNTLPKPGLLYEISLDFELDLANSYLIGSNLDDKELAFNSGIRKYIDVFNTNIDYENNTF